MLRLSGTIGMRIFLFSGQGIKNARWQAACFRAEHQIIAILIAYGAVSRRTFRGEGKQALGIFCFEERAKVMMTRNGGKLVIVQPRAAQALIVPCKSHRFDDMQTKAGISAKTDDVASIWRNFWFVKYDFSILPPLVRGRIAENW